MDATDTKTIKVGVTSSNNSKESKESFTDTEEIDSIDSSTTPEEEVDKEHDDAEKEDEILKRFQFLILEEYPMKLEIKHNCPCHKQIIVNSDLEDDLDDDEVEEDPRKQYRCLLFPWETVHWDRDKDESTAQNFNF